MADDDEDGIIGGAAVDGLLTLCDRLRRRGVIETDDMQAVATAIRDFAIPGSRNAFVLDLLVSSQLRAMTTEDASDTQD